MHIFQRVVRISIPSSHVYARVLINYCILLRSQITLIPLRNPIASSSIRHVGDCYPIDANSINTVSERQMYLTIAARDGIMRKLDSNLDIARPSSADMFLKMVLHVQSDQRTAAPYRADGFSRARREKKKTRTLRHMHGYHETLINCGASPPASRLLCILRAGPRKTTCLSAPANFKMIYRPRKTKFFAVLRGFSAVPKGMADAFDMQLWSPWVHDPQS